MNTPGLQSLIDRANTTLINKLGVSNNATSAIAAAIAGGNYGNYAYQEYLFKQMHPETADEPWLYLWGNRLETPRVDAVRAIGTVIFQGIDPAINIASGLILSTQDGIEFETTQSDISDNQINAQALDAGTASNLTSGVKLSLNTAVEGINPTEIVVVNMTGGADIEDIEHWRSRVVSAYNMRQSIGRTEDYQAWARSAHADIDYAWPKDNYPETGFVTVYIGKRALVPQVEVSVIDVAEAYMEANRLAGCHVIVSNAVSKPLDISLGSVTDQPIRDAITTALQGFILERMGDQLPITPSEIILVVTSVTTSFDLISPVSISTPSFNEVFTLGDITWI